MSPRAKLILVAVGIVLLTVVVAVLTSEQGVGVGSPACSTYSTDARGCKAFFELLDRVEERPPVRLHNLYELERMRGVLVIVGPLQETLDAGDAGMIESWVKAGNGLLYFVGAEEPGRAFCALERKFSSPAGSPRWEVMQYATEETAVLQSVFPTFRPARQVRYKASLERLWPLDLKGVPLYSGRYGTVAAWNTWGRGQVIVCATAGPVQNQLVESSDNLAFLLCALRVLRPQGGPVIFDEVHQGFAGRMGLAGLFSVPGVLAAAVQIAICGVLYVLVQGRRMGPPVELPAGPRRTAEHYLDAAGLLYREHCAPGEVAAAYGAFVSRSLARRLGLGSDATREQLARLLAQRCSMSGAQIESTLSAAASAQEEQPGPAEAVALMRKFDELMRSI